MRRMTTLLTAAPLAALTLGLAAPVAGAATTTDPAGSRPSVIESVEGATVTADAATMARYQALTTAAGAGFPGTVAVTRGGSGPQVLVRTPSLFSAMGHVDSLTALLRVEQAARQSGVRVEEAATSTDALQARYQVPLEAALATDPALAGKVTGYGVHQERGTFVVRVQDATDAGVLGSLGRVLPAGFEVQEAPDAAEPASDAGALGHPFDKARNRRLDLGTDGHRAGAQLWLVTDTMMLGTCTIGYGYRWHDRDYMVTAGHCAPRNGGSTAMLAGGNLETRPDSRLDLERKGSQDDIAVAGMKMSDGVYEPESQDRTGRLDDYTTASVGGATVCHSGARTQGSCGWKVDPGGTMKVAFPIPDTDGKRHRVYLDVYTASAPLGTKADHGDSGGPVYIRQADGRKTLVGSLTGGGVSRRGDATFMFFTGVQAALDAMPGGHPITRTTP